MTREELQEILRSTRRKHAEHWYIAGPDDWDKGWGEEGKSVWALGCVGVVFPPGVERYVKLFDDEGPYVEHESSGVDELYVFPDSTPEDVKEGIAHLNREYKAYLAEGWAPIWKSENR